MNNRLKTVFVLPTLSAGGAERILSFLAQNLDKKKFESMLLVIGNESNAAYCTKETKTIFLNKKRVLFGIPALIFFMKRNKPDLVVSSIGHLYTVFGLLAPFFPKCKFVIREASVISEMGKYTNSNKLYGLLAKIAYNNIDAVICQSKDMAIDFKEIHNIPTEKISIINNPITELLPLKTKPTLNKPIRYITIGRLSKEKGHERLLYILKKIAHPFQYTIVGSGPEKKEINDKISELGLENFIKHISFTKEIGKILSEHDLFLQGFPNAVLESCIVGTPVIAFDAPGGTKEILKDGINGYLVSDPDEFITKLISFDRNKWEPQVIRDSVVNKFDQQIILRQYEDLLLNL